MPGAPVKISVRVSIIGPISTIPVRLWSDFHSAPKGRFISRYVRKGDQGSIKPWTSLVIKRRLWGDSTHVQGTKIPHDRIKQLEGARRGMAGVEGRIETCLAVPYHTGQDLPFRDLRRLSPGFVLLSIPEREGREFVAGVVQDPSGGMRQSLTPNFHGGRQCSKYHAADSSVCAR